MTITGIMETALSHSNPHQQAIGVPPAPGAPHATLTGNAGAQLTATGNGGGGGGGGGGGPLPQDGKDDSDSINLNRPASPIGEKPLAKKSGAGLRRHEKPLIRTLRSL